MRYVSMLLLALAMVQFAFVALPPGNADLISVQSLALDLSRGDKTWLYPGEDFASNDDWVMHHEANLRQLNDKGYANWCFYPPLIPYLVSPWAAVGAETWRLVWAGIQFALIALFVALIERVIHDGRSGSVRNRLLICALVLGSCPLAKSVSLGQTSLLVAVLLWAGFLSGNRTGGLRKALAVGAAVFVKPFLLLVEAADLARRRWRLALAVFAAFAAWLILSVLAVGWQAHAGYWHLLTTLASSQTAYFGNQSLVAGLMRVFSDLPVMDYGFQQGGSLAVINRSLAALILLGTMLIQWRAPQTDERASFGLWISAGLLALPISWEHHFVFLLPVIAFLWTRSWSRLGFAALTLATLLMEAAWFGLYGDRGISRVAANLPLLGNVILFVLLMTLHRPASQLAASDSQRI